MYVLPIVKNNSILLSQLLTYAELGPHLSNHVYPAPSSDDTAVQYATIWHGAIVDPLPSDHLHNAGVCYVMCMYVCVCMCVCAVCMCCVVCVCCMCCVCVCVRVCVIVLPSG